ncbi:YveK family protein [Pseudalkalibacillus sp. Hm43]|uniref:YveK family protein n=1 Tax=Pseudalkalibacillus sp. Hm43 TaxID=3450742 RepID=UPI003F4293BE
MEETISLKEIFATLQKRIWMIILVTVIAMGMSGVISYFFLTPIYQSSTQILVNQSNEGQQSLDINQVRTNVEMINTYRVIIKSPTILQKVQEELGLDSVGSLTEKVTVNSEQNSQVFSVVVKDPDPEMAVNIANTVSETFQAEITSIMNVDNVKILSKAELKENASPVSPNPPLNIAIAMVVGLMVGVGLAFLLEYLDNTIKTEQDLEKLLDLPVLGVIAEMDEEQTNPHRNQLKHRVGSESIEA